MAGLPTATLLILDAPLTALLGIDLLTFTPSPAFHGIKSLPPGLHILFASPTASLSLRHGQFFFVPPVIRTPYLLIKRWDSSAEQLLDVTSSMDILRWRANIGSIWETGLTPYRQSAGSGATDNKEGNFVEETGDWKQLVDRITPELLNRITGGNNEQGGWTMTSASTAEVDEDVIPGCSSLSGPEKEQMHGRELGFLPIDLKRTWPEGAVGRERTEAAKDRSWALQVLIQRSCEGKEMEVIGEMQVCFLMAMVLGNYSCFEQWKRILTLILTCRAAVWKMESFFMEVLRSLKIQLKHIEDVEGGLLDVDGEGGQMIRDLLRGFGRRVEDEYGKSKSRVRLQYKDLEKWLGSEFGWEMGDSFVRSGLLELEDGERVEMDMVDMEGEDERGEYAPVVVDLDAQ